MNLEQIKEIVNNNQENGSSKFEGLSSSDIGTYNRWMMFGDDDEAFDVDAFSAFTD